MRALLCTLAMGGCLALLVSVAWAADEAKGPGGNIGGAVGGAVGGAERGGGNAAAHVEAGPGPRANVNVDAGRGRTNVNVDRGRVNTSVQANRGRIGDSNWDRWGVGRLDDSRFRNSSGNDWRYRRWGNEWWYWMPAGYWMFWRNGDWVRYDPDAYTYGDTYQGNYAASNGPYYEDSNGFYYIDGGRRIYDPSIRRVGGAVGERIEEPTR
jgi:hypothetical protein